MKEIKFFVIAIFFQLLFPAVLLSETAGSNLKDIDKFLVGPFKGFQVAEQKKEFVDFPFYDGLGNSLRISHFRGKFLILNIWATWCIPCRTEMPALDRLQHSFKDEKLMVLAMSQDRAGEILVKKFFKEMQIEHLGIFIDSRGNAKRMTGTFMLPTTIVIDPDGVEVGRLLGGANWHSKEAIALMRYLVEGN
tara:strand:- start:213 stop:788 length:576 start_codon:yes stop_codon:yes gene_type:complete